MDLNIIDVIEKNEFFLKKLFPKGLEKIQIGRVNLFFEDRIDFSIYTNEKPNIDLKKWGEWGSNYTTVVFKISGHFIKNIQIHNWQNNKLEDCDVSIEKNGDLIKMSFLGKNWSILMEVEHLIHQESSTYIDEKLIE